MTLSTCNVIFFDSASKQGPFMRIIHRFCANRKPIFVGSHLNSFLQGFGPDPDPHVFALPGSGQKGKKMNE